MRHQLLSPRLRPRTLMGFCLWLASALSLHLAATTAQASNGGPPLDADLSVAVTFSDREPQVGDLVTLRIDLSNAGPGDATGIEIDIPLPEGLTLDDVDPELGTWSDTTGIWAVPTLAASTATSLSIDALVQPADDDPSGSGAPVGSGLFADIGGFLIDMVFLPNGRSWVIKDSSPDSIVLLDVDGSVLSTVAVGTDAPRSIVLGPDGNLYVGFFSSDEVRRYDASTGALLDTFVSQGSGGLDGLSAIAFEGDGSLLVISRATREVLRFAADGSFADIVVPSGSEGLDTPWDLAIGPNENLYVSDASFGAPKILRYDLSTGMFQGAVGTFSSSMRPFGLAIGPEDSLFVGVYDPQAQTSAIHRFAGPDTLHPSASLGVYVDAFSTGTDVTFGPAGDLFGPSSLAGTIRRNRGFLTAEAVLRTLDQTDPDLDTDRDRDAMDFRRLDFGDAPGPYPTNLMDDGPRHGVAPSGAWVFLGVIEPDTETDGQPDAAATGDGAEEDGVTWIGDLVVGQPAQAQVTVRGEGGLLDAWIDFDDDGTWSPNEQIAQSLPLPQAGSPSAAAAAPGATVPGSGEANLSFMVPADAMVGPHLARFRLSRQGGLAPTGFARDGEIEDHVTPSLLSHAELSISASATPDPIAPGG